MSDLAPKKIPIPDWTPFPHPDAVGVDGKVLLRTPNVMLSILRFEERASIHEHAGENDADVICLKGAGFVSVDGVESAFREGQSIRWPEGRLHRLWTDGNRMETLMVEHVRGTS